MSNTAPHEGPIDPWCPYSLYEIVDGDVPTDVDATFEYEGLHIVPLRADEFYVHADGYTGEVMRFESTAYDDVLELVDDLNEARLEVWELRSDDERRAEFGPQITYDPQKADRDGYVYVE